MNGTTIYGGILAAIAGLIVGVMIGNWSTMPRSAGYLAAVERPLLIERASR